jgi:hypothetical protein
MWENVLKACFHKDDGLKRREISLCFTYLLASMTSLYIACASSLRMDRASTQRQVNARHGPRGTQRYARHGTQTRRDRRGMLIRRVS